MAGQQTTAGTSSDLREWRRSQVRVRDTAENIRAGKAWRRRQRPPRGVGRKDRPLPIARGHVLVDEQVGQVGHVRADNRFAEENRLQARLAENRDLALIACSDVLA